MVGATVGVAALGALYAAFKGGPQGLRVAMILGGLAQVSGAGYAWISTSRRMSIRSDAKPSAPYERWLHRFR
ncbi:MAG: hypothetical protein ACYDAE_25890, partial [Steroidobacteraceae bacterium]